MPRAPRVTGWLLAQLAAGDDAAVAEPAHAYVELLTAAPPRLLAYAAILATVGVAVWRLALYPRAGAERDPTAFARARGAAALLGGLGGAAGLVALGWQLAVQVGSLATGEEPVLGALVLHTRWGRVWAAQGVAFAVAALAFWAARRAERRAGRREVPPPAYRVAAAAAVAAAALQAGLGHAIADEAHLALSLAAGAVHVVAVAAWLGTLATLVVVWAALAPPRPDPVDVLIAPVPDPGRTPWTLTPIGGTPVGPYASLETTGEAIARVRRGVPPARSLDDVGRDYVAQVAAAEQRAAEERAAVRRTGEQRAAANRAADALVLDEGPRPRPAAALVAPQVAAFSRVALASAALVAASGVAHSWLRLAGADPDAGAAARLAALTGSRYGWLLLVKLALTAGVAALGALNWRRHGPGAVSDEGVVALDRTARLELAVATAVLVVTATLAITSPPGTE